MWYPAVKQDRMIAALIAASLLIMLTALPAARCLGAEPLLHCPMQALTGIPCPTCGYSRVYWMLASGHVAQAMRFQPFIVAVIFIVAGITLSSILRGARSGLSRCLTWILIIILAASWLWNLARGI